MKVKVSLSHKEVLDILSKHLSESLNCLVSEVKILTRSKQNYRAVWELCDVVVVNDDEIAEHNKAYPKDKYPEPELSVEAEIER